MFSLHPSSRFFSVFALMTISLGVSLVGVELVLRQMIPHSYALSALTHSPYQMESMSSAQTLAEVQEQSGNFFQPGQLANGFITNSQGLLTPETSYDKPPNTFRIVYIGDSFGVGIVPYYDHFIRIVENRLNSTGNLPQKVEVVNLSLAAIGPSAYERLFEIEAIKYHPDMVIVSFFVGNDFSDVGYKQGMSQNGWSTTNSWIQRQWKSYTLVTNLAKLDTQNLSKMFLSSRLSFTQNKGRVLGVYTGENIERNLDNEASIPLEKYMQLLEWKQTLFVPGDTSQEKGIEESKVKVKDLITDAKRANIPLYFLVIPDELQVNDQLFSTLTTSTPADPYFDMTAPQRKIIAVFNSESVPYLDLLPSFLQYPERTRLYHPQDTHLGTVGNAVAAETLYNYLLPIVQQKINQ